MGNYKYLVFFLFIASCGGGGGGGGDTPAPTPAPSVTFSASAAEVLLGNSVTLTWSSSNATSCSASGSWSGSKGTSGSEDITIDSSGANSFSLTCTGSGGSNSRSVTVTGYRNFDGKVVDGYISGSTVFIDANNNYSADGDETTVTTAGDGAFTLRYSDGSLVSIGGADADTQNTLDNLLLMHKMAGHSEFKVVSPVTTVAAFMEDPTQVNAVLGLDASIDIATVDPVANKGDGGIYDQLYEAGNKLTILALSLQGIANNLNTTNETTQDYFKAITEEIAKEYAETGAKVEVDSASFVTKVIDNVVTAKTLTLDESAKNNTITALSSTLQLVQVKSDTAVTTAIISFATSDLLSDIVSIANGTASEELISNYTTDLINYVATTENIDSNTLTPDITAVADSATTAEDSPVIVYVLLNDSYNKASPISLSAGNPTNGSTSVADGAVTYTPNADYNGSDTFTYTITQGDKTSSADVNITIEAVNDAPTINTASTIQVNENQNAVATISVSDADGDTLTLSLGGTDANSFNLSSENVLTFKEAPDYETKSSYSITLSLTDGTDTVSKDITITIKDLHDELSKSLASDWESYNTDLQTLKTYYGTHNPLLNTDEKWFKSTQIPSSAFTTKETVLETEVQMGWGIGYGAHMNIDAATQYVFYSNWENQVPANGNAWFVELIDGVPTSIVGKKIPGSTRTHILDNGDGTKSVILPGVDEGELILENESGDTYSYYFDLEKKDFFQMENIGKIGAHHSITFDFEGDGDDDVLATTWGGDYDGDGIVFKNNKGVFEAVPVLSKFGYSMNAPFYDDDKLKIVLGDPALVPNHYPEIAAEYNVLATYKKDLSELPEKIEQLPIPYFETSEYEDLTSKFNSSELSHDVASVVHDIDKDGDDDIIISSMIWSDDYPFTVLQILINRDGEFFDETDSRLYNWVLGGNSSHQVDLVDVNEDGYIDILLSDHGNAWFNKQFRGELEFLTGIGYGNKLLLNDGTGHFIVVAHQQISPAMTYRPTMIPTIDTNGKIKWVSIRVESDLEAKTAGVEVVTLNQTISTGPNGIDPKSYGAEGFNEFYYLLHNQAASTSVSNGDYISGLDHYLKVGKEQGLKSHRDDTAGSNYSPVITSSHLFSVKEGVTFIGNINARDADGDALTYSVSGTEIAINSKTGVLTFIAVPDYETKTSYSAVVSVSDGTNITTQNITVSIINNEDDDPVAGIVLPQSVQLVETQSEAS